MTTIKPQTRPAVAAREAIRILDTDETDLARLVWDGRLTEMYTKPTIGEPLAVYNVTELKAIASVRRAEAEIGRLQSLLDERSIGAINEVNA